MYDELVKRLNAYSAEHERHGGITAEAADAIEELSKDRDNWKATAKVEREAYWHWFDQYQKDAPRWIPVTERLPESVHEYVLCCGAKGGQFVGWVGTGFITSGKVMAFKHGGKGRYITHWMPLPQPPKEE